MSEAVLVALAAVPAERRRLDEAELELIDQARRGGATWSDIASALGLTSRQAAEQRRLRLATSVARLRQRGFDTGGPSGIAALRAAAVELDRRLGADRRWDRRFPRAGLARMTLASALTAPPGALFDLVAAVVQDLSAAEDRSGPEPVALPRPTRGAVDRLIAAWEAATPQG